MRLRAAAKINWVLEVLGRRDDGYHEIRSLVQTVGPCDALEFTAGERLNLEVEGAEQALQDNLVLRAATLLGRGASGAHIRLTKHIPVAAGLGGGSSDAAAALRGLNELWRLDYEDAHLVEMAAGIGSDVTFFIHGGTALAEGRGERVTPLPDPSPVWLVLLVAPFRLPEKTRRMYDALRPADFTDGHRAEALQRRLQRGLPIGDADLHNAFEPAAYEVFQGLDAYRDALLAAGARRVHLAGSGPALFALGLDEDDARATHESLRPPGGKALLVRTLTAAEARIIER
jgi:4-diphosphocytidyl-2-C-methyl-D-erythritol kinase